MRKVERIMICTLIVLGIIFTNMPIKAALNEASANGVECSTLEEALDIGGEVTLLEDVTLDTVTTVTEPTVLNLNGHTIYSEVQNN